MNESESTSVYFIDCSLMMNDIMELEAVAFVDLDSLDGMIRPVTRMSK